MVYTDILILATLRSGPRHGYEIKRLVEQIHGGGLTLNNKMLYPALRRFEASGALQREVEKQEGKPDRHIYQLTERGKEILQDLLPDFPPELAHNENEFLTRVAFFDLLEPEVRLDILATRRAILQKKVAHTEQMREIVRQVQTNVYAYDVLALYEQQARTELSWLATLAQKIQQGL